jgi:hypothetical protein
MTKTKPERVILNKNGVKAISGNEGVLGWIIMADKT